MQMCNRNFIILHKSEWDRIKRKKKKEEQLGKAKEEYLKILDETSQQWISSWPDSVQGAVIQYESKKQKQQAKDLAMMKAFADSKKKYSNPEAIKKAKKKIFQNSCYGQQLTSALLESKTLEERKLQIEFNWYLKEKEKKKEALREKQLEALAVTQQKDINELKERRRLMNKEIAEINKNMHKIKIEQIAEEKEKETQLKIEDAKLTKMLLDAETKQEADYHRRQRETMNEYDAGNQAKKERRAKIEKLDEAIADQWRRYHERIRAMEKKIYNQIYNRFDKGHWKYNNDLIEKLQMEKDKFYDDFIESGIKKYENRVLKEEQEKLEKQNHTRNQLILAAQNNSKAFERKQAMREKCRKFYSDQQHFNDLKPCRTDLKNANGTSKVEDIKKRQTETSPWNGLQAAHKQFAQHAGDILQECQYKRMAQKVINNYRRVNCLDFSTSPISEKIFYT